MPLALPSEDWAIKSTASRVLRANAGWNPIESFNAQLDDCIAQTLMSYNPDRLCAPKTY
jgi:hypothetical protein